jgi:asparagine synthase (glutamine-hydrolysing)
VCGIVGIVGLDPAGHVDRQRLERMRDVLAHRGPDGEGIWLEGPVGLGHRRLAIIDVDGGAQPIANEDERVWLTYNGEIYNHAELRRRLERRGHRFRTRCDSEVIVHLYEEYGEDCVNHLRGMFAFAVWDRERQLLLLARDRLGIKPLYYVRTGNELVFASEIKAILAAGVIRPMLNVRVLPEFLATRFVSGQETFFAGIQKLLPGRTLEWSASRGARIRRYWRLPATPSGGGAPSRRESAYELRSRLRRVVESHLMSDVPLGIFLSGGLDSSLLAAMTAEHTARPPHTFAVGLNERDANELSHARLVAASLGAQHHDVTVTRQEVFDALPSLIWHEDEPLAFPSSVLLYFVSKLAGAEVKVVLTGEGADELFLGYNWYRTTAWNERLGRAYWSLSSPSARHAVRSAVASAPPRLRRYASRSFLALDPGARTLHCENFAPFGDGLRGGLLSDAVVAQNGTDPYAGWLDAHDERAGSTLERLSHADLQTFLVELLMKQDQMSMAASVESRVPYLDHELVEHATQIPADHKLRGLRAKAVLRDAAEGLVPPAILRRRKMGFPVPVDRWLRGPSWPLVEHVVLGERALSRNLFRAEALRRLAEQHRSGTARHGERLWLLLNLELWHRVYIDGQTPSAALLTEA